MTRPINGHSPHPFRVECTIDAYPSPLPWPEPMTYLVVRNTLRRPELPDEQIVAHLLLDDRQRRALIRRLGGTP